MKINYKSFIKFKMGKTNYFIKRFTVVSMDQTRDLQIFS